MGPARLGSARNVKGTGEAVLAPVQSGEKNGRAAMDNKANGRRGILLGWAVLVLLLVGLPATAQRVKDGQHNLDAMVFQGAEFRVPPVIQDSEAVWSSLVNGREVDRFRAENGTEWKVWIDARRGRPSLLDGGAIPFLPGHMNTLPWSDVPGDCHENRCIPVAYVESLARNFMEQYRDLLRVDPAELVLDSLASGPMGDSYYTLRFQWVYGGIPVENASVFFRINNGNLLQVSTENIGDIDLFPKPTLSEGTAREIVQGFLGAYASDGDKIEDAGSLAIVPTTPRAFDPDTFKAEHFGKSIGYRLVRRFVFKRPGVIGTWEALLDAHTGEVLRFVDIERYGRIHGSIRPSDGLPPEEDRPFPFADTGLAAPDNFTDGNGNFPGNSATTTLNGKYSRIVDACGAINASTAVGEINFGSGPAGTDCSVPAGNTYGAGNTKASRTLYYNCTAINLRAQVWAPTNNWLKTFQLRVNVNGNAWCNATAGGGAVNFYKAAAGCNNLGEVPGVAMHEWAHNYDSNDGSGGQTPPLETYADFTAAIQTHNSCLGAGFLTSGNCGGYGDACTNCTGVRDMDWAKHTKNTPWKASNKTTVWSADCSGGSYFGPCGWEDHCEAGPSEQALWDLVTRDLVAAPTNMDLNSAWMLADRLWFSAVTQMTAFYACSGTPKASTGCGGNYLYTALRFFDDDGDGTANGTPHAAAIFAALNRHEMACGAAGDATNQNQVSCPSLSTPVLSGTGGNNQVVLNWTASTNATRYFIFRNESNCSSGSTRIAVVNAPTLTYTDLGLINGANYYYYVQGAAANDSCTSSVSNCLTATPIPCTTPGVPTIGTVTVPGLNQLRVSWTAGAPAGATYRIYRALGACPGGTYTQIATGVAASPYTDSTVSGTVTYSYKVSAADATGVCESALSGCASNTATGVCNMGPVFAGLTSVTNSALSTCTLALSWSAATAYCGGPVTYTVYRHTTAPFTPGPAYQIATGVSGTTYTDATGLATGTTYYYIVRATDSTNGAQETNAVTQSGAPTGPITIGTWSDDAGDTGTAKMILTSPWAVAATGGRTAPKVYATGTYAASTCVDLKTPVLFLGTNAVLSFASKYDIETNWDAGILEVATAPTFTNWTKLAITTYPNSLTNSGNACSIATGAANVAFSLTNATPAYSASPYTASLSAYNDQQVQIRWKLGTDTSVQGTGWWVDDVTITNVQVPGTCTTGSGCTAPGAPNLASATGDCNGINLTWSAGTGTTLSYNVYRGTAAGGPYTKLGGMPIATTTYADTTAVAGTTYYYVVKGACDAGGSNESGNSTERNGVRSPLPATPAAPVVADVNACAQSGVTVTWGAVAGSTGYDMQVDGTTTVTGVTSPYSYNPGNTASHTYTIRANNGCGNGAFSGGTAGTDATNTLTAPAAPAVADASACSLSGVTITWGSVAGATGYDLQVDGTTTVTDVTSPYTYSPGNGASHSYTVRAKNASCASAYSTATLGTDGAQAPPSVGTLTMSASAGKLNITWTELVDPSQADYYEVMRALAPAGPFDTSVGTVAGTLHGLRLDLATEPGTAYYKVRAVKNGCPGPM